MADVDTAIAIAGERFEPGIAAALIGGGVVRLGEVRFWGGINPGIAASDGYAYFLDGRQLTALDVGDPATPFWRGQTWELRWPLDVAVAGGFAFVVGGMNLSVVDVRDPWGALPVVGSLSLPPWPTRVAASGNLVLAVAGAGALFIVDVSDPFAPRLASIWTAESPIVAAAISGATAYVARAGGLDVLDLGDPAVPLRVGVLPLDADLSDVVVVEGHAYAAIVDRATGGGGLVVIDVRDPGAPAMRGAWTTGGFRPGRVSVEAEFAYVTGSGAGIRMIDVSDPSAPTPAAILQGPNDWSFQRDVATSGGVLLDGSWDGLATWDIRFPKRPPSAVVGTAATPGPARDIAIAGSRGFVACGDRGLRVLDLADAANPRDIGGVTAPGNAMAVAIEGDLAYLATGSDGLRIADARDPATPFLVGHWKSFESDRDVVDVAVAGGTAYLAAGVLKILDVRDPSQPAEIGSLELPYRAHAIAVSGHMVFVAAFDTLFIVDVESPAHPVVVGSFAPYNGTGMARVAALGTMVFAADGMSTYLLDVSEPSAPVWTTTLDGWGIYHDGWNPPEGDLVVDRERVLLARSHGEGGVVLVGDLRDPSFPVLSGAYDLSAAAAGIAFDGAHVVVAAGSGGVQLLRPDPALRDVESPSDTELTLTVPSGYRPGPYHVDLTNPGGDRSRSQNALLVCERHAFGAALRPRLGSGAAPQPVSEPIWTLALDGDEHFFAPRPKHVASVELPELPGTLETRWTPGDGSGRITIDLRLVPGSSGGIVELTGDDREATLEFWEEVRAAGSIALRPEGERTYGEFRLSIGGGMARRTPRRSGDRIALAPTALPTPSPLTYRFVAAGGALVEASASGPGTDLVFAATGRDAYRCGTSTRTSYRDELRRLCQEADAGHPELAFACAR